MNTPPLNTSYHPFDAGNYHRHPFDIRFELTRQTITARGEAEGFTIPDNPQSRAWSRLFQGAPQTLLILQEALELLARNGIETQDVPGFQGRDFVKEGKAWCRELMHSGRQCCPVPYDPAEHYWMIQDACTATMEFGGSYYNRARETFQDEGVKIPENFDGILFDCARNMGALR